MIVNNLSPNTQKGKKQKPPQSLTQTINIIHTVDGWNPAPVEVGSLSHYFHGFIHPRRWSPDFWTTNPRSRTNGPPWEIFALVFSWALDDKSEVGKMLSHYVREQDTTSDQVFDITSRQLRFIRHQLPTIARSQVFTILLNSVHIQMLSVHQILPIPK